MIFMADFVELCNTIRRIVKQTVEANKPSGLYFGTVTSVSPLEITIDTTHVLTEEFIVLAQNVTKYRCNMTINHLTELETTHVHIYSTSRTTEPTMHSHEYKGRKTFLIHKDLQKGEKVILLREQGGQKYVVIDRIG